MFGSKNIGILIHPGQNDIGSVIGGVLGFASSSSQSDAAESAASSSAAASKYATDLQRQMYEQTRQDQEPWRRTGASSLNMLAQYMGLPNEYAQYYGMSDEALRNALLPQYTTMPSQQPAQNTGVLGNYVDLSGWKSKFPSSAAQSSPQINEAELAKRMAEIKGGLQGYDPNAPETGSLMRDFSMQDFEADPGYAFRMSEGMKALERSAAARGGLLSGATMKGIQRYGQDLGSQEYQNAFNRYQSNQSNKYNRLANVAGLGQTANQALQSAGSNYASNAGNLAMTNAANQGNAALVSGQARASAYGGIGNALSNVNWGNMFGSSSTPYYSSYDPAEAARYLG